MKTNSRIRTLTFWNDSPESNLGLDLTLANALSLDNEGWALLAPYGDSHYPIPDGKGGHTTVIQRITKESAQAMVETWNSTLSRVRRFFRGGPIYSGHPDRKGWEHLYPDKEIKGLFNELQVRDNGLYVRPLFNDAGAQLLEGGRKLYFSGRWPARQTGTKDGMPVFEPFSVTSIGLTPNPNLPTEMLNAKPAAGAAETGAGARGANPTDTMNERQKLLAALISAGILTLNNEATDDQIVAAVRGLHAQAATVTTLTNERDTLKTTLAARDTEVTNLKAAATASATQFENERKTLITHSLDRAQKLGAITEADRKVWEGRLTRDFANEFPAFEKLAPTVKTDGNPAASGARRDAHTAPNEASSKLISLTNERIAKHPEFESNRSKAYLETYNAVCAENPALVEASNKPA